MYLKAGLQEGPTPVGPLKEVPGSDCASVLRVLAARVCMTFSPAATAERQQSCKHPGNASAMPAAM